MIVFTHRGLEPGKNDFWPESSYEAFKDQIERGFGIEFDPNFCKDGIVVSHDKSLSRITEGQDSRQFAEATVKEVCELRYGARKGRIPLLREILEMISKNSVALHAMHLKGLNQTKEKIDLILEEISKVKGAADKILIFDVKPELARYIKSKIQIKIAPSVAHVFDIERYNSAVSETLISMEDALKYKEEEIYDWVWLDEWDLTDRDGKKKRLYTKENFDILRSAGYKIALVTPELHGTSPGLLGGEAHSDAKDKVTLFNRIKDIISINPDAICTDYPELYSRFKEQGI